MRTYLIFLLVALTGGISGAAVQDLRHGRNPFQPPEEPVVVAQAVFNPITVTPRTRVVYVREYANFRPRNGAPVYYAPFPNTLCMLGEGSQQEVRIIHEAHAGACEKLIQVEDGRLVRPIKDREGGDTLHLRTSQTLGASYLLAANDQTEQVPLGPPGKPRLVFPPTAPPQLPELLPEDDGADDLNPEKIG